MINNLKNVWNVKEHLEDSEVHNASNY